jgi:hypothetical protein
MGKKLYICSMGSKHKTGRFWKWAGIVLLLIFLVRQMPLYKPAPEDPFSGPYWYNPYEQVHPGGRWLRANFHAHSNTWGFFTNGRNNTVEDILDKYDSLGYDIVGVSDYQKITETQGLAGSGTTSGSRLFIPVYEHGFNLLKTHQGSIGARKVFWNDFILPHTRSQKQHILNRLGERSALVALNHPAWMGGYGHRDVRRLSGYHLFEVLNDFWISEGLWDEALSSGKSAMLIAGDDAHNVFKPTDLARDLTMIFTSGPQGTSCPPETVYRALETGAVYGIEVTKSVARGSVMQKRTCLDAIPVLQSCRIKADSLFVVLNGRARQFNFIGQEGVLLKSVQGTADSVTDAAKATDSPAGAGVVADSAFYILQAQDSYVRVKIALPDSSHIYLNPVMRTTGKNIKPPMPQVQKRRLFTIFDS